MATLFVRHDVEDFATWKKAYDDFDAERETMGVTGHGAHQAEDNPNNVTIYPHFETMDAAKAFMGNPRLREVMMTAGVQGEPTVWFATRARPRDGSLEAFQPLAERAIRLISALNPLLHSNEQSQGARHVGLRSHVRKVRRPDAGPRPLCRSYAQVHDLPHRIPCGKL